MRSIFGDIKYEESFQLAGISKTDERISPESSSCSHCGMHASIFSHIQITTRAGSLFYVWVGSGSWRAGKDISGLTNQLRPFLNGSGPQRVIYWAMHRERDVCLLGWTLTSVWGWIHVAPSEKWYCECCCNFRRCAADFPPGPTRFSE